MLKKIQEKYQKIKKLIDFVCISLAMFFLATLYIIYVFMLERWNIAEIMRKLRPRQQAHFTPTRYPAFLLVNFNNSVMTKAAATNQRHRDASTAWWRNLELLNCLIWLPKIINYLFSSIVLPATRSQKRFAALFVLLPYNDSGIKIIHPPKY